LSPSFKVKSRLFVLRLRLCKDFRPQVTQFGPATRSPLSNLNFPTDLSKTHPPHQLLESSPIHPQRHRHAHPAEIP
jgi:hypothetical protein